MTNSAEGPGRADRSAPPGRDDGSAPSEEHERAAALVAALDDDDPTRAAALLQPMSARQVVAVLERLDVRRQAVLFRLLPKDRAAEVFDALPPTLQGDLVRGLQDDQVAGFFAALDPDDRVRLLDELPASVTPRLLRGLSPRERRLTDVVIGYPRGSVGRRMSPEYVSVHPEFTAGETLARVRRLVTEAETVYTIPVVARGRRLVGVVGLRDVLAADAAERVGEFMVPAEAVPATLDAEQAARRCTDLGHLALPVVDGEGRLVGILTLDDAVDILEEAESEDAARQGGAEPLRRPYLATPVLQLVRSRLMWLFVLAIGATLTVQVLDVFEETLAEMTVLSLFVPLLIGVGGNTGNQAATTVTRALALGDVGPRDLLPVLGRELRVGLVLGVALGVVGALIASVVYSPPIGAVIGLTLLASCTMAASVGGMMPLVARAVRVDPAVFSNPFISTFVDAAGLIVYFLIARAVLGI